MEQTQCKYGPHILDMHVLQQQVDNSEAKLCFEY